MPEILMNSDFLFELPKILSPLTAAHAKRIMEK